MDILDGSVIWIEYLNEKGVEMFKSNYLIAESLSVVGILFVGWFIIMFGLTLNNDARAGSSPVKTASKSQGNSEQGRKLYNGKGICYYCHGIDGFPGRRPQLNPRTNEIIDRLRPKPANLRDPGSLKLKNDDERYRLIRDGHIETGMFPDKVLTDEEIKDVLAYLSELRRDGASQGAPK